MGCVGSPEGGVGFEGVAIWFGMVAVSPAIAWIPQLFSILQSQGVLFPKARWQAWSWAYLSRGLHDKGQKRGTVQLQENNAAVVALNLRVKKPFA